MSIVTAGKGATYGDLFPEIVEDRARVELAAFGARARTVLSILRVQTWADLSRMSTEEIGRLPNVGRTTLTEISAAIEARVRVVRRNTSDVLTGYRDVIEALRLVNEWAASEQVAGTLGQALSLAASAQAPADVREAWSRIASQSIVRGSDLAAGVWPSVEALLLRLSEQQREVVYSRILTSAPLTLEQIAAKYGVTRERIRQVQLAAESTMSEAARSSDFRRLAWRAQTVASRLGAAAPCDDASVLALREEVTRGVPADHEERCWPLLLRLAGSYRVSDGWYETEDAPQLDIENLRKRAGPNGVIELAALTRWLSGHGVLEAYHQPWLSAHGLKVCGNNVLIWSGSVVDKCVALLAAQGSPASVEDLLHQVGEEYNVRGVRARFFEEPRLMRVNQTEWALREWGLEEYSGIAQEIVQRVEAAGGQVGTSWLVEELIRQFGVKESSVRFFLNAPLFVSSSVETRLRRPSEIPSFSADLSGTRGAFRAPDGRLVLLVSVDTETLRGSGRPISVGFAAALGLTPGANLTFADAAAKLSFSWPMTSPQPSIGSARALLGDGQMGDILVISLDRSRMALEHRCVGAASDGTWRLAELLPWIEGDIDEGLGRALDVASNDVRRVLRQRGDDVVLCALPPVQTSAELDDALDSFAELLGKSMGT